MTPNGAIVFGLLVIVAAMLSSGAGLAILLALCLAFALIEIAGRTLKAIAWSAGIVAPLAIFMALIWIAFVGRSPAEIAANVPGTRLAALVHVVTVCGRLFLVALVMQLVTLRFAQITPLQFIRAITAPLIVKKLTVLTLSLIDTILHAVDRARTALVAAGVITARMSVRNFAHGWLLIQATWLSVVTIATGRLRDKWPAEDTLARLDHALAGEAAPLTRSDVVWMSLAIVAAIAAVAVR
jgi:hypothetical protein